MEINKFKKRLKVILKYYTQEYSENRVGLFDLGYLSIFFELAGKILDSEEHRVLALQVRDRLGRIMLKSFISGEFFRSHGSNIIALEIWKEMKKPCDIFEAYKDLISERYFKRVDEFLVGPGKFELLEGAVGFSMVAKSLQNKAALKRCENYLKENLEQTEKIPAYFCDTSDYDKLHKAEIFPRANLGLAHGQTAVLSHSVFENKVTIAKKLAKGFIKIDQSLNGQSFPTHWPQYPVLLSRRAGRLRSAWCYGDAGIGHSLLLYSQRIKDLKARRLALETLYRGLAKDHWKSTIEDGHFCHGAGGMAQISLRCYQLCKDPELLKLLKFWIKKLDCPFSDLSKHSNVSEENKKGMSALLMGPLGSAFTMISFLSKNDFKWDRIFLLSDPRSK